MSKPLIQVVNDNDQPIGAATKQEAISNSNFHRISRVMLENPDGKILLQKRSSNVPFPGLWDHSASGHVDEGENYLAAAKREMHEELGIDNIELKEIAYYKHTENLEGITLRRFNRLYHGTIDFTPSNFSRGEVSEVRWFSLDEIYDLMRNHPEQITPGVKYVVERHYKK